MMMSDKIDWTQKLGDAFLAQQKDVLAAAQKLRNKALAEGNLKDSKEQKVSTEQTGTTTTVKIEPTNPDVVYVPTYNPTVVYGAWPYPSYPPATYYPPGYAYTPGAAFFTFAAGAAVGAALWGNCNWGAGDVNVNVNRYNTFNRSNVSSANWSHNAAHRGAVPYRSQSVAQQYGRGQTRNVASREQFRGRAQAGQSAIQRGEVPRSAAANRGGADRGNVANARGAGSTRSTAATRSQSARNSGMGGTAFDTGRGSQARDFSSRGTSSLSAARSSGNFGGSTQARSFGGGSAGGSSFGSGRAGGGGAGGGGFRGGGGGGRGGGGRR
jgi:hypothetical protein